MDNKQSLIETFFKEVAGGKLPENVATPDMTAWTLTSGEISRERFAGGVRMLSAIFGGTLTYTIDTFIAQDDRVVVEAQSTGRLTSGEDFHNHHVFIFRLREGRVAEVREYMNPIVVAEKLLPLMASAAPNTTE